MLSVIIAQETIIPGVSTGRVSFLCHMHNCSHDKANRMFVLFVLVVEMVTGCSLNSHWEITVQLKANQSVHPRSIVISCVQCVRQPASNLP